MAIITVIAFLGIDFVIVIIVCFHTLLLLWLCLKLHTGSGTCSEKLIYTQNTKVKKTSSNIKCHMVAVRFRHLVL